MYILRYITESTWRGDHKVYIHVHVAKILRKKKSFTASIFTLSFNLVAKKNGETYASTCATCDLSAMLNVDTLALGTWKSGLKYHGVNMTDVFTCAIEKKSLNFAT